MITPVLYWIRYSTESSSSENRIRPALYENAENLSNKYSIVYIMKIMLWNKKVI